MAMHGFGQNKPVEEKVTVKSIVGKAEVKSLESGQWREARVGMIIKMKWDVRTYVESSMEIQFESGTIIKLGEKSVVNLSSLLIDQSSSVTKSNVNVATGQVWANVKKMVGKQSKFTFETPTAVAAIRGTRLGLSVDKDKTVLDVYEGSVNFKKKGSRKEKMINTKTRAIIDKNNPDIETSHLDDQRRDADTTGGDFPGEPGDQDTGGVADTGVTDTTSDSPTEEEDTAIEVNINIESPDDNAVLTESPVLIKGTATPGAVVSIGSWQTTAGGNGKFTISVDLVPGVNTFIAVAQIGTVSKQSDLSLTYEPPKKLFLSVTQPADGMKITEPIITVAGVTVAGAEVSVDDNDVAVRADGSFSHQVHIPNETGEYVLRVVSRFKAEEMKVERKVMYAPVREKLDLIVTSPVNGQVIKSNLMRVTGKAVFGAKVAINGGGGSFNRTITVGQDGSFTCDINLYERDIGEYVVEVSANLDETGEEKEKVMTVQVDIKSPGINISKPKLDITSQFQGATRVGYMIARIMDQTPEDQITLQADINGSKDQYTLEPSGQEKILLDEGKNRYALFATDLAGNKSNAFSGEIYYLPGPLVIDIIEPDESMYNINDLPPMPVNAKDLSMDIEIEIDDGIGDVDETILYCRVNNANLKKINKYIYRGKIPLIRGVNNFLVEVEDMAGNREKKTFTITINE